VACKGRGADRIFGTGVCLMANIKNYLGAAGAAVVASLAMSTAVLADDAAPKFGYSITLTGTSDYIFRGISLTNQDPAFQPFIEFTYGIAYLDFWGSNVRDGLGDPWELDIYAGIRPVTGPVSWDFGVLYYTNPNHGVSQLNTDNVGTDYVEFKAQASITPITNLTLTGIGYITPDVGFASPQTETGEFDVSYTLPAMGMFTPTLSGAIGYTNADRDDGLTTFAGYCTKRFGGECNAGTNAYTYWNAGVKLAVDKWFLDFRYWDTDISHEADQIGLADSRFVFSAGITLP
jgi:uncharacterized protein (TIGR02001 family)